VRCLVQRVASARVLVDGDVIGAIERGLLVFVGVDVDDTETDADVCAQKIAKLRVFPGKTPMDQSVADVGGSCLVVSQFTLAGSVTKGNRPSFTRAASHELAERLYERVATRFEDCGLTVARGRFAASMSVELTNDGPVTFVVDSRDGRIH
jgi:D-tyrosyl-tRNA(Tyr) deacylase